MPRALLLFALGAAAACSGGDDQSGGGLSCSAIPACYAQALTALQACVTTPTLALGTPTNNSGVVDNLHCTGGNMDVAFATFSFSPTGTVPIPSSASIMTGGAPCATVKRSTGTHEMGGTTRTFQGRTIEIPGATAVEIDRYDDDTIEITCGTTTVSAAASSLSGCGAEVVTPEIVRDAAITMMGVTLVDPSSSSTALLTCSR